MSAPAPLPPEARALVLAALAKRVAEQDKLTRAEFARHYFAGVKRTFRSPLDEAPLGYVQRTDPDPTWTVTDRDALLAHLGEYPGALETVYELHTPAGSLTLEPVDELVQVLREHAPHLLTEVTRVREDAIDAALEQSKATGAAAAPGIALMRPGGTLRVVPHREAAAAVQRMVAAGLVGWDGTSPAALDEAAS